MVDAHQARWRGLADPLVLCAVLVFVVYAGNFLYFFVDDEAIPLVFARNLLRGRGLSYNTLEGPVEGYTDFLHVLTSALTLGVVHAVGASTMSVFFIGKAVSFLAGIGTVVMTWQTVRRTAGVTAMAALAGLLLLATAGPLAVWACSSLETATFVFLLSVLLFAVHAGQQRDAPRLDTLAAVTASAVVLERLDGPVYVAAVLGAYVLCADSGRRRILATRVGGPVLAVLVAYHGWRIWYFGDWLNLPIHAKILYKLWPHGDLVTRPPAISYWAQFVEAYGWVLVGLLGLTLLYGLRDRRVWPVIIATGVALAYASIVGDWMFGLRMFAAALPWLAVGTILSLSVLESRRPLVGVLVALAIIVSSAVRAGRFEAEDERVSRKPSFLRHPGTEPRSYFGPYYSVFQALAPHMRPGTRMAYNQAGFVPFLLDADNIDDLGICSKFYAKLPTTDVFFTEAGRYAPLREGPVIGATEAYLLHHDVRLIVQRNDLLRHANEGGIPPVLLGGYFVRDASFAFDTIYRRSDRTASEFQRDPRLFTENLAHTSHVTTATLDGTPLGSHPASLEFLRSGAARLTVNPTTSVEVGFGETDKTVFALGVNRLTADREVRLVIELRSQTGAVVFSTAIDVPKAGPRAVAMRLTPPVNASRLHLSFSSNERARVRIEDLRVLGQSALLADYIHRTLSFH